MKHVRKLAIIPLISLLGLAAAAQVPRPATAGAAGKVYFPARDRWEVKNPADVGMDAAALDDAIAFAKTAESSFGKVDYHADQIKTFGRPLGPVPASRGGMNAVIVRHGY